MDTCREGEKVHFPTLYNFSFYDGATPTNMNYHLNGQQLGVPMRFAATGEKQAPV